MPRVYLDTCCLNRPFDDQTQDRVRLEAEAVGIILHHVQQDGWEWLHSEILAFEISEITDADRRSALQKWLEMGTHYVGLTEPIIKRAEVLKQLGFHRYDALHLAATERGRAEVFFTTDDRLLRTATRHVKDLTVEAANPEQWLRREERKVFQDENA